MGTTKRAAWRTINVALTNPVSAGVAGVLNTAINPWKRQRTTVSETYRNLRSVGEACTEALDEEALKEKVSKEAGKMAAAMVVAAQTQDTTSAS